MRLAAILALCATPALSQGYPESMSADTLAIEAEGAASALVTYYNSDRHNSENVTQVMHVGDIVVEVQIEVGKGRANDELFIVRPFGDFIAVPDQVSVPDGERAVIRVMLPMF